MITITLIYVIINLIGNLIVTNEVGTKADVLAVVKNASAKVIKFTTAPEAELELAA